MAQVTVHTDLEMESPTLVEGLPGAGLVGKIAADHLVESLDMDYVASCYCEGLPQVAAYRGNSSEVRPPVRIYGDRERDLLVLQSDIPVSPSKASAFANCLTSWFESNDVFPLFLSGLPQEKEGAPEVYGIATGDATNQLDEAGIVPPRDAGLVTGPTGALIHEAGAQDIDSVGLIAETEAQFPDPEAARSVLTHGIEPLTGIEVETESLVERADEIQEAREQLVEQMQGGGDESSEAKSIRGFQ